MITILMFSYFWSDCRKAEAPFSLLGSNTFEILLMKIMPQFGNLVELKLTCAVSNDFALQFFTQLGTTCLKMKLLKLGSRSDPFPFFPHHQLALVLGGRECLLPPPIIEKFKRGSHNRILFDSNHVTSICNSLEFCSIRSNYYDNVIYKRKSRQSSRRYWHSKLSFNSAVFLLRHLSQLKKLSARFHRCQADIIIGATSGAVQDLFNEASFRPSRKVTEKIGVINGVPVHLRWTTNNSRTTSLILPTRKNLTSLKYSI